MYTKELEDEQKTQTALLQELSELTSILKDTTLDIHSTVKMQNTVRVNLMVNESVHFVLSVTFICSNLQ